MKIDKPSNFSDIKSMRHGMKYQNRCESLNMYELLTWPEPERLKSNQIIDKNMDHFQKQFLQQTKGDQIKKDHHKNEIVNDQVEIRDSKFLERSIKMMPHQIKGQAYYYDEPLRKRPSLEALETYEKFRGIEKPKTKKLDNQNKEDKKIIAHRQKIVDQFKHNSRELPNTSFITYFGKPAFQLYGYLTSDETKRTHNIMPHLQENNPKYFQSYNGALVKAKSVSHCESIPRKPINQHNNIKLSSLQQNNKIKIKQLPKPDLINNVRFKSPQENSINAYDFLSQRKEKVPSHISTFKNARKARGEYEMKKKKHKKAIKRTMSADDGLKYFNSRDSLFEQLEEKKKKSRRLPYKVTEYYPEGWPKNNLLIQQQHQQYGVSIPAGKKINHSESAKSVIYGY